MRLQDIPEDIEPRVGDIIEIEQDDVCFEVRIIGITADGYLCEQDNVQGAVLLEGVALDHNDVADIAGYITEERVRLDPKCWKGKKIGNPKTKMKGGVRVNNCVPEGQENNLKEFSQDGGGNAGDFILTLARAWYMNDIELLAHIAKTNKSVAQGMISGKVAVEKILARGIVGPDGKVRKYEIDFTPEFDGVVLYTDDYFEYSDYGPDDKMVDGRTGKPWGPYEFISFTDDQLGESVAEAGPFSYGYKPPRKGSVAYWAEKKRKEQEKGKPPIEPKDQMVGVAKVTKGVAEGSDKLQGTPVVSLKDLDDKDTKKDKYGRTVPKKLQKDDPRVKFHKDEKQGVAEGWGFDQWGHDTWTDAQKEVARKKKYEMMLSNGKVKRFTAKDDADAKRIAKGHGAKSVIKMKGDLPGNKIAEQGVAEGYSDYKDSYEDEQELYSGCYVRDRQEGPGGEVFVMRGDPEDRRVRIEDRDGRGWYISPYRLELVDENDPAIKQYFGGISEAKSLKKRVRVVQGEHAGKTGWIREIKHGIHSTAPKRYYVDIDGGGQANNLPASALRLLKNQSDSQKGMAEGGHDDQFSLSGEMPATNKRIPQDSTAGQDKLQAMVARMKQRTIDSILDEKPEWERSDLELMTAAELNQILRDIQSGKITEAEYQGRKVPLGKPMAGDVKKSKVYVRKPNGKVVKVNFGDKNMTIKKSNPKRRKSFRARHNCQNPGPRWKARYWSCRAW